MSLTGEPVSQARPTVAKGHTGRWANLGVWGTWLVLALALALLPVIFRSGTSLTMMSLMGISIVFALSYNILLGQTGMLSFGHAVYFGLGAYFTVHAMNAVIAAKLPVPVAVMPLAGGIAGLGFAMLFGWVSTKRSGTAFAMISLGLAELVGSSSLILRSFFGGEEGVSTNRTKLLRVFDFNFGSQIQVYYLIVAWCFVCIVAMYALTRTPLGRICNAVRDNPERVQFVGYNPHVVRYLAFSLAGFFAGYVPGSDAVAYPTGTGKLLKKGQPYTFQMHYISVGTAQTEQTELGLYVSPVPPTYPLQTKSAFSLPFVLGSVSIPASTGDFQLTAQLPASGTLTTNILLYEVSPHMHLRGAAFKYEAIYPGGAREVLASVPNYIFHWQALYRLTQPKYIPRGSRIVCTATWDNTTQNKELMQAYIATGNPSYAPTHGIRFGDQSWDEMFIGYLNYAEVP